MGICHSVGLPCSANGSPSVESMEKRVRKIAVFVVAFAMQIFAQVPSVVEHIRIPLWAELDAYPGLAEAGDMSAGVFDFPVNRLRQTAPYIIEGMVYGWNFTYTPSDKLRRVSEFFEIEPIQSDKSYLRGVKYSSPWINDNRLNCWVEFNRTSEMVQVYNLWASINHPTVRGRGTGKISSGFDGITDAVTNAVKDAVRTYFRGQIKNKPKEITGKVLIRKQPEFGIRAGEYVIQLDFFLETDRIIQYNMY